MPAMKFLADSRDDRDALNEATCHIADLMQRVWPKGIPEHLPSQNPQAKIREQLMFELSQTIHTLLVTRVRELEKNHG
jgi:hypothetical protein